jgi:molybdopterin synthase catalytic subunit
MSLPPSASVEGSLDTADGKCVISHLLNVQEIISSVQDDTAGAIAVFIGMIRFTGSSPSVHSHSTGTTRNSFKGYSSICPSNPLQCMTTNHRQSSDTFRISSIYEIGAQNHG